MSGDVQRFRLRFTKQGDLRFLSHRDLARAWERAFKRAAIPLRMSGGFHPKPRICFPSALAVGVAGTDEAIEADVTGKWFAAELAAALAEQLPRDLALRSVRQVPLAAGPAKAIGSTFELAVPSDRQGELRRRLDELASTWSYVVDRGPGQPIDLATYVEQAELTGDVLRVRVSVKREGTARPRELLALVGLSDLEQQGVHWTRTAVELDS